jgi:hypothetical protein
VFDTKEVLVPQLHPGRILIMDNRKAHQVAGVAAASVWMSRISS